MINIIFKIYFVISRLRKQTVRSTLDFKPAFFFYFSFHSTAHQKTFAIVKKPIYVFFTWYIFLLQFVIFSICSMTVFTSILCRFSGSSIDLFSIGFQPIVTLTIFVFSLCVARSHYLIYSVLQNLLYRICFFSKLSGVSRRFLCSFPHLKRRCK